MKDISILFVCMGNICRSPLAEGIFTHLVNQARLRDRFTIDSAGTGGWHEGEPPDRRSIAVARRHGIDIAGQRARRIRSIDFVSVDLIVAMDRDNVAELNRITSPEANIQLFGDIALGTGEDIADPYYGGPEGFELLYTKLLTGCSSLLETLVAERTSCSGNTSSVR
ncbi:MULTISPECIES: low molecular weight protein-tyrosine-phosphatase [Rhizobium]|uniref:low molecular weight protein-tyrosine-phosphatase n=1 Tax=Rhizobium TaxID=379 RepID=UPI0007F08E54|nr:MULTISPECIES: low molecular weight protein-tyrosine-phosphatase [Rhizobium]ANK93523.1 low molecular weight protein-tyrosine-phosphatase protein [Rhizobium sp. N6212]ANK99569.1 low molecular weight protein-tyrosine-phosphatase protein [Rhizobium sp. N621]ANL05699.1 low molecular weight protein-tyrosine-phosphatase protein [Rhizobium esperanzae]ANL11753.1 low molecular weight protein-tyrosine-phosphatase protein [Rhizobium sp. N1341]ANL23827.1 low molecular weight protein-tyrosine-phosphatase